MSLLDVLANKLVELRNKRQRKAELMEKVLDYLNQAICLRNSNKKKGEWYLKRAFNWYSELCRDFKIVFKNYDYWRRVDCEMDKLIRAYYG